MPESLNSSQVDAKNALLGGKYWVWLIQVQVNDSLALRVCTHDQQIAAVDETAPPSHTGYSWQPFPVKVQVAEKNISGVLTEIDLILSNLTREIADYVLADDDNILGRKVKLYLVTNADDYAEAIGEAEFLILGVAINQNTVTLRLGRPDFAGTVLPTRRYLRTRCAFAYGDNGCAFPKDGSFPNTPTEYPDVSGDTCDYGLNTGNGCRAHGALAAVNGYPVEHPLRFGGQPSIPKGPAKT